MEDPIEHKPFEARKAFTGIGIFVLLVVLLLVFRPSIRDSIYLILGFVLVVMLHEFGHFIVAKRAGMKVSEYFLGFGPRLFSFHKGETEYGVKLIPAGGYVKIVGMHNLEEVPEKDEARTYRAAPYRWKMAVVLAGVAMNLLLAAGMLFAVAWHDGELVGSNLSVASVQTDSAAKKAGLRTGDVIQSVNGQQVTQFADVQAVVRANKGNELEFGILRNGTPETLTLIPQKACGGDYGYAGIAPGLETRSIGPGQAFGDTMYGMGQGTIETGKALGRFFSFSWLRNYAGDVVSGDVTECGSPLADNRPHTVFGIVAFGSEIVDGNLWTFLALMGGINFIVGLLNLIPLLPFDGGHAAVATYEKIASLITRRHVRANYRTLVPVITTVIVILLLFFLSALWLELRQAF